MRRRLILLMILGTSLICAAQPDLKARVDAARAEEKGKLALKYVEQSTQNADIAFKAEKDDQALAAIQEIAIYSKIASDAAIQSGKSEKNIEIGLRKVAHRLAEIKNAQAFDTRDDVQRAIDAIESARADLLNSMFKKKQK